MTIEELKSKIEKAEKSLSNPMLQSNPSILESVKKNIENYKKQLAELESKASDKVDEAKQKVDEAETPKEKKEAQQEVKEAKKEEEEAKKVKEDIKQAEQEIKDAEKKIHGGRRDGSGRPRVMRPERPKMPRGGRRLGAGRKKASSPTKIRKPEGIKVKPMAKRVRRKKVSRKPVKAAAPKRVVKEEMKTVRAFGQSIQYKNNAEFCKKLIGAFKKRKKVSRGKKRKTKPVFGIITSDVKNAVSKALHSVPKKQIEKNPKEFLAKAQRLEKSAIKFLEDFKAILGSDYKKSEITSEFGELEKSIKSFVAKYTKK